MQDAKASLENYQNYNWGSFEMLRDHTSKPKSVEAAQVQLEEAAAIEAAEAGAWVLTKGCLKRWPCIICGGPQV